MAYAPGKDLGTPKYLETAITVVQDNPGAAAVTTVTVPTGAGGVPVGTKGIAGRMTINGNTANDYFTVDQFGKTNNEWIVRVNVANQANDGSYMVALDSSYRFDTYASSANIGTRIITINAVYL
jgi:hypothetical protein